MRASLKVQVPRLSFHIMCVREARALLIPALLLGMFLTLGLRARSPVLLQMDERITWAIQRFRTPWLDHIAEGVTLLGSTILLLILGVYMAIEFFRTARPRAAWFCLLSLLGLPMNFWIKQLIGRARPKAGVVQVVLPASGLSFPSGHAMVSVMFYGFLGFLIWTYLPRARQRRFWAVILTALTVCIGLSRVYLGVHWFSDVVGGWIVGLFFLMLLIAGYRAVAGPQRASARSPNSAA